MSKIIIDTNEVLTPTELALALDLSLATVYRRMRKSEIFSIKVGGKTYIPKSEIERLRSK